MTKKDYQLIATAIKQARVRIGHWSGTHDAVITKITEEIADKLQADNPRFDRARFINATF